MTRARATSRGAVRVGVISDTHGSLPDRALAALEGVDAIVHAGDVGGGQVLDLLRSIAPVTAVRGNMDHSGEASQLDGVANVSLGGVRFLVGHKKGELVAAVDPGPAGVRVVVTGHSHRAHVEESEGILYVNPGSAGSDRGNGLSMGVVEIEDGDVRVRIVEL